MSTPSLPLSSIIPVTVNISPTGAPGPTFNQALIVGSSPSNLTAANRVIQVTGLAGMTTAGFSVTSPEYLEATLYFDQSPQPTYLNLGLQVLTAIQTVSVGASGGTGYAVGDILGVAGGTGGQVKVVTVSAGVVTAFSVVSTAQGSGYSIATNAATTVINSSGTGAQVNILTIGETPVQAMTACRNFSPIWYIGMFVGPSSASAATANGTATINTTALTTASAVGTIAIGQIVVGVNVPVGTTIVSGAGTSWVLSQAVTGNLATAALVFYAPSSNTDKLAIAGFIEAASPLSAYFTDTTDANVLNLVPNNLAAQLKALGYNRTVLMYTTTQGGTFPNNIYADGAFAGVYMGRNTWQPGSYFTGMFKPLVGIAPEPLSISQVNSIAGPANAPTTGLNCNLYLSFNNGAYKFVQNAVASSGRFFDITLFLDMLSTQCQVNGMDLLVTQPSIPLNNVGIGQMANAITQACVYLQQIGFINTSGTWQGVTVGNITAGTPMPKGYSVVVPSADTLSPTMKTNRQFPPFTVLIILAQSGQSLAIGINVQQ